MVISNGVDNQPNSKLKLNIIFENNDFLIINKPSGLVVHPLKSLEEKTLVSLIIKDYPTIKNVGENQLRPGIVHRLDKDVSGLMIIAKNQSSFDHLKNEFKNHRVSKKYLGLVFGIIKKEKDTIISSLTRDKRGKMTLAKSANLDKIKESWTEYKVIKRFKEFSFLKLQIKTGRTHQIRLHLKSIGHPIVGDNKHKIKRQKNTNLNRLFLHAYKLGFFDKNNQWQEFRIDLPIELKNFLQKING